MSSDVINFISFCLTEITEKRNDVLMERTYLKRQSLGERKQNDLETECTEARKVNICESGNGYSSFDSHENVYQTTEINKKHNEIHHINDITKASCSDNVSGVIHTIESNARKKNKKHKHNGCEGELGKTNMVANVNQVQSEDYAVDTKHTKNKQLNLAQEANICDNDGMVGAVEDNGYKKNKREKNIVLTQNDYDKSINQSTRELKNEAKQLQDLKEATSCSTNTGLILAIGKDREKKSKHKDNCQDAVFEKTSTPSVMLAAIDNHERDDESILHVEKNTGHSDVEMQKKKRKRGSVDHFNDVDNNFFIIGCTTEDIRCKKRRHPDGNYEDVDASDEKTTYPLSYQFNYLSSRNESKRDECADKTVPEIEITTDLNFKSKHKNKKKQENVEYEYLLNCHVLQDIYNNTDKNLNDTQHKRKRKHKEHSGIKDNITIDNNEQDINLSVQRENTLDSEIQECVFNTCAEHRKRKDQDIISKDMVDIDPDISQFYNLMNEASATGKKQKGNDTVKEVKTINEEAAICDFSNSNTSAKKQKEERERERTKNVQSLVYYEDFKNKTYVETDISQISENICNKQDFIPSEQRYEKDNALDSATPVTRKKRKHNYQSIANFQTDISRFVNLLNETSTTRKKKKREDNVTKKDVETISHEDFKNKPSVETDSVNPISTDISNEKGISLRGLREEIFVQSANTLDGDIQQCISDSYVKHKKKRKNNDTIKEVEPTDHQVPIGVFSNSNTSAERLKEKRDKKRKNKILSPIDHEDCKDMYAAETDIVSPISANIYNEKENNHGEQREKADVHSNNTLNDDIQQCMPDIFVKLKNKKHEDRNMISKSIADFEKNASQLHNLMDETTATSKKKKHKNRDIVSKSITDIEEDASQANNLMDKTSATNKKKKHKNRDIVSKSIAVIENDASQLNNLVDETIPTSKKKKRKDRDIISDSIENIEKDASQLNNLMDESIATSKKKKQKNRDIVSKSITDIQNDASQLNNLVDETTATSKKNKHKDRDIISNSIENIEKDASQLNNLMDETIATSKKKKHKDRDTVSKSITYIENDASQLNNLVDETTATSKKKKHKDRDIISKSIVDIENDTSQLNNLVDETIATSKRKKHKDRDIISKSIENIENDTGQLNNLVYKPTATNKKKKHTDRDINSKSIENIEKDASQLNYLVDETITTSRKKKKERKKSDTENDVDTINHDDFKNKSTAKADIVSSVPENIYNESIVPREQREKTSVQSNNTFDGDIYQCMSDTHVKRKQKKHKDRHVISESIADIETDASHLNNLMDETVATSKKKKKKRKDSDTENKVETINCEAVICDTSNTPVKRKKEKRKDRERKNKIKCPGYIENGITPREQNKKIDVQSNNTLDGDIYQCVFDTPVKRKKKKRKDGDIVSESIAGIETDASWAISKNPEECRFTSDIKSNYNGTMDDNLSEKKVESVGHYIAKCETSNSNTPENSRQERTRDMKPKNKVQSPNTYTDFKNNSPEEAKPSWLNFSPEEDKFTPDKLGEWLLKEEISDDEEIYDAIATFDDNLCVTDNNMQDLHIIIDWKIPVLHTIETRLTAHPSREQMAIIKSLNVEVKKGYFSKEETDTIINNFEEFCIRHDLPLDPRPFLKFRLGKGKSLQLAERIHFVQYLAKGLDNRLLNTVYRRFQNIVMPRNRTGRRFSAAEDKFILNSIKKDKFRFAELAKILSRHPHSILKRFDTLTNGKYSSAWRIDVCEKLLKAMIEVTLVVKVEELKHRHIYEEEWIKMADKVGVYAVKLKDTWYRKLHPQLFIPKGMTTETVIQAVIYRLRDSGVTEWNEINWNELAEPFEGWTGPYLKTTMYTFYRRVPVEHRNNLKEFYEYLLKNLGEMQTRKRKTLAYEDGHLICI